jgi:hypothetical protein
MSVQTPPTVQLPSSSEAPLTVQNAPSPETPPSPQTSPKLEFINWAKILEAFAEQTTNFVLLLIALFSTAMAAWLKLRFEALKDKVAILSSRILDPFFTRPELFDQYATNLILIGEGGSGKTTIVHALSGCNEAAPDIATSIKSTYTLVNEVSIETGQQLTRRLVRVYTDDYAGQNWTSGAQSELVKKKTIYYTVQHVGNRCRCNRTHFKNRTNAATRTVSTCQG